jgi:signal transduction histidine kinase
LSIVKHLVQALGGSITASSQPGTGTTFTLRIPVAIGFDRETKDKHENTKERKLER